MRLSRSAAHSALALVTLLTLACGGATADDPPPPDGSVDGSPGDGSTTDAPIDDATADGARVRMLIDVPFMEGSPVDNRFTDPQFTMEAAACWFEYDATGTDDVVHVDKRVLTRAPAGQATLHVPGRPDNPHGVSVVGGVKLSSGAHEGSLWIGTVGVTTVHASVLALDASAPSNSGAFDFAPDLASARDLDGIHWVQYTVSMPKGSAGWGFALIQIKGVGQTYLHAPVMRSTGGTTARFVGHPTIADVGRPPTMRELALARRAFGDHAKVPARPPLAVLPPR